MYEQKQSFKITVFKVQNEDTRKILILKPLKKNSGKNLQ